MSIHGDAAELLNNLELTTENWPIAWKMLDERYSKKRLTVSAHLSQMCNASIMKKKNFIDL